MAEPSLGPSAPAPLTRLAEARRWVTLDAHRAATHAEAAMAEAEAQGDVATVVRARLTLALAERIRGGAARAKDLVRLAIAQAEVLNRSDLLAELLLERGKLEANDGTVTEAYLTFQAALEAAIRAEERHLQVSAWGNLGTLFNYLGDKTRAAEAFLAALQLLDATVQPRVESGLRNNYGILLREIGDVDGAALQLERALLLRPAEDDRIGRAATLGALGEVAEARGQWAEAEAFYHESLAEAERASSIRLQGAALRCLGQMLAQQGRYDEARLSLEKALVLHPAGVDEINRALLLVTLAEIERRALAGSPRAVAAAEAAWPEVQAHGLPETRVRALRLLAEVREGEGNFAEALRLFRQAHEEERRYQNEANAKRLQQLQTFYGVEQARRDAAREQQLRAALEVETQRLQQAVAEQERQRAETELALAAVTYALLEEMGHCGPLLTEAITQLHQRPEVGGIVSDLRAVAETACVVQTVVGQAHLWISLQTALAGGERPPSEPCDVAALVGPRVEQRRAAAAQRHQLIVAQVHPGAVVVAPPTWLAALIDHLLDEALAAAPSASVVTLRLEALPESRQCRLTIADQGLPPPQRDEQRRLPQRWSSALAQRLAAALGASLQQTSAGYGQGCLTVVEFAAQPIL